LYLSQVQCINNHFNDWINILAIIITSMKNHIIPYVVDMEDSWKALQELFETHNDVHNFYIINKLLSIRMEETCLIVDFLKKIKEITTQLVNIRKMLQKNELVQIKFNILPKSFESFIQVVRGGNQMLTFDKFSTRYITFGGTMTWKLSNFIPLMKPCSPTNLNKYEEIKLTKKKQT